MTAPFVLGAIAFVSFDLPQSAVLGQQNQSTLAQPKVAQPKADGLFLYGEAPQPKQTGKGYVVFQRQQGKVVGATYFPNSEFECFTGSEKNNTLDVKSVGVGEPQIAATKINLSNLHQIKSISADEERLISVCKQETASPINK
ncbi:hypothetical protein H6F98_11445 [Microcoleus sp. FACHB-SPT15]|uniref:hypothetical protein n=1 Tax=Microcoleus sp. FACHB-SPT15 TaxID=2692830 RepID=UPI00177F6494|nr:hypothetical protein [Microcoleus sp. FACHB-SPT15]MBD1806061.1 hypothetical protein [Microcoleus sp. FACHB-SPT15]